MFLFSYNVADWTFIGASTGSAIKSEFASSRGLERNSFALAFGNGIADAIIRLSEIIAPINCGDFYINIIANVNSDGIWNESPTIRIDR